MDEKELGRFLRSRREAVTPEAVGLPPGSRRRTPGLRRAEVATLAGISVDYLVRLEQGRDRRPSAEVLAALADALQLDEEDRNHLRTLASVTHTAALCPSEVPAVAHTVRPTVQALLDRIEPAPAFVLNRLTDVVAWTSGYQALAGPLGVLDRTPPNLLRFTFTDERARQVFPDWDAVADEQVANLWASCGPHDPHIAALIDDIEAAGGGEGFSARWRGRRVARKGAGVKRLVHPEVGELRIAFETLRLPEGDDLRLVAYLPGDDATAAALDQLSGRRPGALRAVGG